MNSKVLVICYDYGINQSPNTRRWEELVRRFVLANKEVYLLTASNGTSKKYEIVNGCKVYRTGHSFLRNVDRIEEAGDYLKKYSIPHFFKRIIKNIVLFIHDVTWKKIYWPDFAIFWSLWAIFSAYRIIRKEEIEYCIVVSRPFSTAIIPLLISIKVKNLHWGIDYIDPFFISKPLVNNTLIYNRLNRFFEYIIIRKADIVFVLNERIMTELINVHLCDARKFKLAPNILLGGLDVNPVVSVEEYNSRLVISYIGSLNSSTRSPKDALVLLKELIKVNEDIELHFYGEILNCEKYFYEYRSLINKNIFIHGVVSRDSLVQIVKKSDILLNIGNDNKLQEPSKILDYISAAKPIISLNKLENDASQELLDMYEQSLIILMNEHNSIDQAVIEKVSAFIVDPPQINYINRIRILNSRSPKEVSYQFLEFMN
jgi:hypothetical protein